MYVASSIKRYMLMAKKPKYYRDWLIAELPFVYNWSKQLALLEFFICLGIAYDSTLSVHEMFQHAINSIDNHYLRKEMAKSLDLTFPIYTVKKHIFLRTIPIILQQSI
jgi:type II secretory pathway component PulF